MQKSEVKNLMRLLLGTYHLPTFLMHDSGKINPKHILIALLIFLKCIEIYLVLVMESEPELEPSKKGSAPALAPQHFLNLGYPFPLILMLFKIGIRVFL